MKKPREDSIGKVYRIALSKKRIWIPALAVVLLLTGWLLSEPLLQAVGNSVVYRHDPPGPAEAAVVLSGNVPDRARAAADLFYRGQVSKIWLAKEVISPEEAEMLALGLDPHLHYRVNQRILDRLGIPSEAVRVVPGECASTWEEALAVKALAEREDLRSLVVVTSNYHSYRSYLNFKKALEGTGVEVYVYPSPYTDFDPDAWWQDRDQIKTLYVELASLTAFYLGRR